MIAKPTTNYQLPTTLQNTKVALVCDWLTGYGGAELVLLELHELYPHAPIYTSQYDPKKIDWFKNADVRTGWLQKLPLSFKKLLPILRAWYFSGLDLSAYDVVISCSGAEAKGVIVRPGAVHISYCHSPTHYYWNRYEDYLRNPGWGYFDWLARMGLKLFVNPMRKWDYKAAQRPHHIIANSTHTQTAIKEYYNRESVVIHPPVDTEYFEPSAKSHLQSAKRSGFVITGRQTPYKRFDLAVEACSELGLPLTVVGDGPEHEALKQIAGPTVTFLGKLPRQQLKEALQSAEVFIFPGLDDFGIAAVEALAAGTPVIAYEGGGALDYIKPGKNGEFFFPQTLEALKHALAQFNSSPYNQATVCKSASNFSVKIFRKNIQQHIQKIIESKIV